MTALPEIPSNLKSNLPKLSSLTPTLPQFPEVPGLSNLQNISDQLSDINPLVKVAFPISLIRELVSKYKEADGSIDFNKVTEELNQKINTFVSASRLSTLEVPEIPLLNVLETLVAPTLPVIKIPTLADVQEHINSLKEQVFIEQQKLINETQLRDAQAELQPFSNRQSAENAIKSKTLRI